MRNLINRSAVLFVSCLVLCTYAGSALTGDRSYVAGKYFLTLDTAGCGFLKSMVGGGAFAEVVLDAGTLIPKKHIGGIRYEDLTIETGFNLSPDFYRWINESWQGNTVRKNGVLTTMSFDLTPLSGLQFNDAIITETTIPACDAASKDDGVLTVKLAPEYTRNIAPTAVEAVKTEEARWLPANFRLEIDGLDCTRVNKIDAFTIKQTAVADDIGDARDYTHMPGKLEFPDLFITMSENSAGTWKQWFDDFVIKGNNGDAREKSGRLIFLSPDLQREYARIEFSHLGIRSLRREKTEVGSDLIQRVTAQLYCERMTLVCNPAVTTPATTGGTTPTTTTTPTEATADNGNEALPAAQKPGDNVQMGTVYAIGTTDPLYFNLLGADFTTGPVVIGEQLYTPNASEKLMVLRFSVQNPQETNRFVRWDSLKFTAVDPFGVNHVNESNWGVSGSGHPVAMELLPAQKLEAYTVVTLPAKGPVPKLIVQAADSRESPVLRYDLRRNVTPLERPVADPADETGSTALEEVAAQREIAWPCKNFSVNVEKFAAVTSAIMNEAPPKGGRFLVVTLLVKNQAPTGSFLRWDTFTPVVTTTDGDELRYEGMLLASTDRNVAQTIRPGAEMRVRLYFTVPAETQPRSLSIREGEGRSYLFQLRERTGATLPAG